MNFLEVNYNLSLDSYDSLFQWSIKNREDFWKSIWEFAKIIYSKPYDSILQNPENMLESRWFSGSKLNFAENLLRYKDDHPAIIFQSECIERKPVTLSYKELYDQVSKTAKPLRDLNLKPNDRVAAILPNMPEAMVAMLSTTSIGAIWTSASPEFGLSTIYNRFGQVNPKVLFISDGYFQNGKPHSILPMISKLLEKIPSIEKVIVVPYINKTPEIENIRNSILFSNFQTISDSQLKFEQLPAEHPIYIMYTSGTTGIPKCIVQGAIGNLLQHFKEQVIHSDIKREDRVYFTTTCGWVLWNWMASILMSGATLILRDGSPFYPNAEVLMKLSEDLGITHFGCSARYITSLEKLSIKPKEKFNLSRLRSIMYGGSALTADGYEYIYRDIKSDLMISSMAGGTEIVSCFAIGNLLDPIYAGEMKWGLGMNCNVFNEKGESIKNSKGELVCTSSFPCQPLYFWNDPNNEKYKEAYFSVYPNIWRHGDYAELTSRGTAVIYGRSDATLNPGGVRIGTSEIYQQIDKIDEIEDSIAIGQNWENDVRIILFTKLRENQSLTPQLIKKIKTTLLDNCTPAHVPAKIISIKDIPCTINGKNVEIAVKKVINGEPVPNISALANPEALELYKDLDELKS